MVNVELKQWGNSIGVILPTEILKELGLSKGDEIDVDIIKKEKISGFGICKRAKPFEEEEEEHKEFW